MRIKKLLVIMSLGLVLLTSAGVPALAKDLDENTQEGSSEISGKHCVKVYRRNTCRD